jgi:hypothetical protein
VKPKRKIIVKEILNTHHIDLVSVQKMKKIKNIKKWPIRSNDSQLR